MITTDKADAVTATSMVTNVSLEFILQLLIFGATVFYRYRL